MVNDRQIYNGKHESPIRTGLIFMKDVPVTLCF